MWSSNVGGTGWRARDEEEFGPACQEALGASGRDAQRLFAIAARGAGGRPRYVAHREADLVVMSALVQEGPRFEVSLEMAVTATGCVGLGLLWRPAAPRGRRTGGRRSRSHLARQDLADVAFALCDAPQAAREWRVVRPETPWDCRDAGSSPEEFAAVATEVQGLLFRSYLQLEGPLDEGCGRELRRLARGLLGLSQFPTAEIRRSSSEAEECVYVREEAPVTFRIRNHGPGVLRLALPMQISDPWILGPSLDRDRVPPDEEAVLTVPVWCTTEGRHTAELRFHSNAAARRGLCCTLTIMARYRRIKMEPTAIHHSYLPWQHGAHEQTLVATADSEPVAVEFDTTDRQAPWLHVRPGSEANTLVVTIRPDRATQGRRDYLGTTIRVWASDGSSEVEAVSVSVRGTRLLLHLGAAMYLVVVLQSCHWFGVLTALGVPAAIWGAAAWALRARRGRREGGRGPVPPAAGGVLEHPLAAVGSAEEAGGDGEAAGRL